MAQELVADVQTKTDRVEGLESSPLAQSAREPLASDANPLQSDVAPPQDAGEPHRRDCIGFPWPGFA
jgi:hypothetical protein